MEVPWWALVLGVWAALGPTFGVWLGQYLWKTWTNEHWIRDNTKQECKEVISVMARTFSVVAKYYATYLMGGRVEVSGPHDVWEMRELEETLKDSHEVFYNQFFIANELTRLKTRDRWIAAITEFQRAHDNAAFAREFGTLAAEIRGIARKAL